MSLIYFFPLFIVKLTSALRWEKGKEHNTYFSRREVRDSGARAIFQAHGLLQVREVSKWPTHSSRNIAVSGGSSPAPAERFESIQAAATAQDEPVLAGAH